MKNKLKALGLSICSFMAVGFDVYALYLKNYDSLLKLGLLGSCFLFGMFYYWYFNKRSQRNFIVSILSSLFTFFMIFGNSYMHLGNALLVFKNFSLFLVSVVMACGYYFIFASILHYLFVFFDKKQIFSGKIPKLFSIFEKHPFLFSFLLILICWLPYIISFYPIILSPDPSFQIKQFFGIRTKYADYAVLLDENVVLTNHHPVVHTLLLGGCLKFGHILGNDNFGLFCYSLLQILILASVLSFTIWYMKKMNVPARYLIGVLLIYALVPMFPLYAMSGVKDVLFASFTCLYIILIHHILKNKGKGYTVWHYVGMVLLMLLVILFRNNGLHMILLSFPFVILSSKKIWKSLLSVFCLTILLSTCYSKIILPAFHITPGSVREMLSIPFQQTARYVKYHAEDLSMDEKKVIDQVLGYETLAQRYNPELSDPVKNQFNKYATKEDLQEYFKVWLQGLFRHPTTYIDATINNVYGFFYPEKTNWYVYYKYDTRITEDGFDYHYNSLETCRNVLSGWAVSFPQIPILGLLSNIGFSVWIIFVLIGYMVYKKSYSSICIYLPAVVLILVCIAGPANTYFRYALPFIFSLPFMIACVLENKAAVD